MIRTESTIQNSAPRLGLSLRAVALLAAIAAIRVPLHDLGVVDEGSVLAALLVFLPLALWVVVALRSRAPNPLLTLTIVGFAYGVLLAVLHQVFWGASFGGDPPSLGGNLEGVLAPGVESAVFRVNAFFSSLVTGTLLGAVTGAVAWAVKRLQRA